MTRHDTRPGAGAAAHTPGPWKYHLGRGAAQRFHVQTTAGYQVASTPEVNRYETREADARLIAAAPELLQALKGLVSIGWNDGPLANAYEEEVLAAEAAITKAEGKS